MNITSVPLNDATSSATDFTPVDYAIVVALLTISLAIGIFIAIFKNGSKTMDDFLFGGFQMAWLPVAMSLLAR